MKKDNQSLVDIVYNARITLQGKIQLFQKKTPLVFWETLQNATTHDGIIDKNKDSCCSKKVSLFPRNMEYDGKVNTWLSFIGNFEEGEHYSTVLLGN